MVEAGWPHRVSRGASVAHLADAGGSNGHRSRAWKLHLQRLADRLQIPISVCHYPPGTSKWNKIEHRLFSFISLNWRGKPLRTFETMVNMIGATRTRSGLKVKALLDTHPYEKGMKVSAVQFNELHIRGRQFHPDWNYTLVPRSDVHQRPFRRRTVHFIVTHALSVRAEITAVSTCRRSARQTA